MICWLWETQAGWVVRPQPPNEEFATTVARPVACRAAAMPGEPSLMTLSPRIHTRSGSVALGAGPGANTELGVIGPAALDTRPAPCGDAVASWAVPASGGATVAASSTAAVAPIPIGTIARLHHLAQSAFRSGPSTR